MLVIEQDKDCKVSLVLYWNMKYQLLDWRFKLVTLIIIVVLLHCCLVLIRFLNSFPEPTVLWRSSQWFVHLMCSCPAHVWWFRCLVCIYFCYSIDISFLSCPILLYFLCYRPTSLRWSRDGTLFGCSGVCESDPRFIQVTLASCYGSHKRIVNTMKVYTERN